MRRDRLESEKAHGRTRLTVQLLAAAVLNGYAAGFRHGKIYAGPLKTFCVPVLNCYSCPGALGSCPIGALQAVIGSAKHNFSFYVLGSLMLFGVVLGRLVCGFLCPFGFIQDLLYKIPVPKAKVHEKVDRIARYLKYVILAVLVVLLPMFATDSFGTAEPFFCKWFCPAGTLEGGIPLVSMVPALRQGIGLLFWWKVLILLIVVTGAVRVSRFFCRYFCPLGAFYSLFNRFSFYQMNVDSHSCVNCGKCASVCPMGIDITCGADQRECIRCGKCKAACPQGAICSGIKAGKGPKAERI